MLQYKIQYPAKYAVQSLYLYFDTDDQWKAAYDKNKKEDGEQWYTCTGNRSFHSRRPRWWYLAVGNCDSPQGLFVDYEVLMTNSKPSNRWFYHFSFDEFYVLPISIFFMVLEILILIVSIVFTYLLKARNLFHSTFKLFLHALALHLSGQICLWLHFDRYADNGRGFPLLRSCGLMLRQFASVVFVLLLLLIAKGYTITRGKISAASTVKLLIFMTFYLVAHVVMLVWELALFDPAEVTYISESSAAYVMAALTIVAWLWYLISSYKTVRNFWAEPVALVISNFVLDNWVRAEVMLAVESLVECYGFIVFLVLTAPLPGNSRNFFPYHHVYEQNEHSVGPSPHDRPMETKY
ncbi:Transmembrane protein [Aphelenchoides fujianensis]|nr:Transmembrane protein [Aphelenchoides fujianensis]